MTTGQWITVVVLFLFPVLFHLFSPIARVLEQKLPVTQQKALVDFSKMAVQRVEQRSAGIASDAKKQIAMVLVIDLFKFFKIPLPSESVLDTAIESAVFLLPKSGK